MNWRLFLFPFGWMYGIIIRLRNYAYNSGLLPSTGFSCPIISIGNLSMGGNGKTPLTMYLVKLLKEDHKIATLSRGYGRKTKGFKVIKPGMTAEQAGDEPLMYKINFPDVITAVGEDRVNAMYQLLARYEDLSAVILDDAFQHRKLKAGLKILVTDYNRLYTRDHLFPVGTLREYRSASKRADIIIVTKVPEDLSEKDEQRIADEINPKSDQSLFLSHLRYGDLVPLSADVINIPVAELKHYKVILVTGIASPKPLMSYLKRKVISIRHLRYSDHHIFNAHDIAVITKKFNASSGAKKIIITTEKDAMRFQLPQLQELLKDLPVYYQKVELIMHKNDKAKFENKILNYVGKN